jgi:hypothetical protein
MAELQVSVVTNDTHRSQIFAQIRHWEDTLERLYCEQFRLRCYMASLQNGELPNPKVSRFPTGCQKKLFLLKEIHNFHNLTNWLSKKLACKETRFQINLLSKKLAFKETRFQRNSLSKKLTFKETSFQRNSLSKKLAF